MSFANPKYLFSGSGTVHLEDLGLLKEMHSGPIYVVNLKEDDTAYIDNLPRVYFGAYETNGKLYYSARRVQKELKIYNTRRAKHNLPCQIENAPLGLNALDSSRISYESQHLERMGIHYISFPLPDKIFVSNWSFISSLLELFDTIPEGAWVHFHCNHGGGRTTTAMVIYDIYKNQPYGSIDEILSKHHCLGGENLKNNKVRPNGSWTKKLLDQRYFIVKAFYDYINSSEGLPRITWLEWMEKYPEDLRGPLPDS